MKPIKVSAPGKLHILGEHAVVYGKPALIAAINKRCITTIVPREDRKIEIISYNQFLHGRHSGKRSASRISNLSERFWTSQNDEENVYTSGVFTEKEIIAKTKEAQIKWETYIKNNKASLLKSIASDPLDFPVIVIGEAIKYFKTSLPFGFNLTIKSDIPIGSGMGSSAALAVSIAGAVSFLLTKKIDKEAVNEIAYLSEQRKHGLPSGGDNSASCFGGLIWYRKETPDLKIIKTVSFAFPKKLGKNFVAIHTGIPAESTGEMVSIVRSLYQKKPEFVESILSSHEKLTRELLSAIKNSDETLMIRIIRVGERNLESLGVVSEFSKSIIREIEASGGAAKICGGGGKQKSSGVVLAYHKNPELLNDIAKQYSLSSEPIVLEAEGVREEII